MATDPLSEIDVSPRSRLSSVGLHVCRCRRAPTTRPLGGRARRASTARVRAAQALPAGACRRGRARARRRLRRGPVRLRARPRRRAGRGDRRRRGAPAARPRARPRTGPAARRTPTDRGRSRTRASTRSGRERRSSTSPTPPDGCLRLVACWRPGGRLLLSTPAHGRLRCCGWRCRGGRSRRTSTRCADHLRFYTRSGLIRLLGEFGFQEVSVRAAAGPPGARRLLLARAVRSRW